MLDSLLDWMVRADPPSHADAIFVLAGHKSRKIFAIQVLNQGLAPRVLFSVGRFEIRRFPELGLPQTIDLLHLAQSIPPPLRHFFVLFEKQQFTVQLIPVRTLGTMSEIDALAEWLNLHREIKSLLLVSSGPHLRRLRICCRVLLPGSIKTSFVATPEENAITNREDWWNDAPARRTILSEWAKIACYVVVLPFWKLGRAWRSRIFSGIAPG